MIKPLCIDRLMNLKDTWEGKRLLRLAFEQDDPNAGYHLGMSLLSEGFQLYVYIYPTKNAWT